MINTTVHSPFFTIITPVLNGELFINDFFASLYRQTFKDWQIIVVDDGSTDSSIPLLNQYAASDCRVIVTATSSTPKLVNGPYQARNTGLDIASGQYILFWDIDDRWSKQWLQDYRNKLIEKPYVKLMFSGYYRLLSSNGRISCRTMKFFSNKYWIRIFNPVPMLTACVDADYAKNIYFKPLYHEDYQYWIDLYSRLQQEQIYILESKSSFATYRVNAGSLSGDKSKSFLWWFSIRYAQSKSPMSLMLSITLFFCVQFYFFFIDQKKCQVPFE